MRIFLALALFLVACTPPLAHPHVWVTARGEAVYDGKGSFLGIRHAWSFDEMFSSFATQGLDTNNDGQLSRQELSDLAQTNVTSLREYDYFTYAKIGGKKLLFKAPEDYWLEFHDKILTLHFFLPLQAPQPQGTKPLSFEIYDPTYFVDFELTEHDPIVLTNAPGCALDVRRPKPPDATQASAAASLDQQAFDPVATGFGAQFANVAIVICP